MPDLQRVRERAGTFLSGFSPGQKVVTVVALLAFGVGGFLFTTWASKPSYAPLFTNLDSADAAAITEKLNAQKVPYQLADGGRTILVPEAGIYQLRLDMSAANLPSGGSAGYGLLDKQGVTTSEFRQRVDYQRALEGELAKTIGAVEGVAGASVHLVIPKEDVFSEDSTHPSASVLVKTRPGASLDPGQVQAVVHLVSSSVEGLEPTQVTLADAKGRVLSAPGEEGLDVAAGDLRSRQTKGYENDVARSVEDMLGRVMGADRAVVRVKATLDFDQREVTTERFDGENQPPPLTESTTKETFNGTGGGATGVLGPDGTPLAPGSGGEGTYGKDEAQRSFAVGKVTEQVKGAPGQVKRLSVAVLLDSGVKGAEPAEVERLVSAAAGLDPQRGDTIEVSQMRFDQSSAKEAAEELRAAESLERRKETLNLVRTVGTLAVMAVMVLLVLRTVRKARKGRRAAARPIDLEELQAARDALAALQSAPAAEEAVAVPELQEPAPPPQLELGPQQRERALVQHQVGELIERQPEEVAQLLRGWLADRRK